LVFCLCGLVFFLCRWVISLTDGLLLFVLCRIFIL
jgi:hypothetical protein